MIKMRVTGSYKRTREYFKKGCKINTRFREIMRRHAESGVKALQEATPKDTGETAGSWGYKLEKWGVSFTNSNSNVAILLQYGHATRSGGYIEGVDYINPALRPIFEKILQDFEKEVRGL